PAEDRVACDAGESYTAWLADNGGARVSDECGPVTWTAEVSGDPTDCNSSAQVTFIATDACGNQRSSQAEFRIEDNELPQLLQPATDLTLSCPDPGSPELQTWLDNHGGATATDNCGQINWAHDFTGDLSCASTQTITFTATDACGNAVSTSATLSAPDDVPPTIVTEAADEEVACLTGNEFTNWLETQGGAQATDNCGTVTWSHDHSGSLEDCDQTVVVTFTATDDCGNAATTQATFRVNDDVAPTLESGATDLSLACATDPALEAWLASNGGALGTDNCGSITWTNDYTAGTPECAKPVTVTFTVTDACGNSASTQATVELSDTEAPAFTTEPQDLTSSCQGGPDLDAWLASNGESVATDNCGTLTWSNDWDPASLQCNMTTTVTFTATDGCGNTATAQADVSVVDDTAPVIDTVPADFLAACEGGPAFDAWLADQGGASATDNCGDVTWTNDFAGPLGICDEDLVVTFTATDVCGNTATTQALVQVQDTEAPVITVGAETEIVTCGTFAQFQEWLDNNGGAEAVDNCATVIWSHDYGGGPPDCNNETLVAFTATDGCGNTAVTTGGFTIEDE
ncbi:MAG: hypothetical protein R3330_10490, partial [Saprospiraceae bacterium]|nr:hypothetical protein [Saprospiraceae bacterium]